MQRCSYARFPKTHPSLATGFSLAGILLNFYLVNLLPCPLASESQFYRLLPAGSACKVTKVEYVVQPLLMKRFNDARRSIKEARNEDSSYPVLGFHGTEEKNIESICETGFRVPGEEGFQHATDPGEAFLIVLEAFKVPPNGLTLARIVSSFSHQLAACVLADGLSLHDFQSRARRTHSTSDTCYMSKKESGNF